MRFSSCEYFCELPGQAPEGEVFEFDSLAMEKWATKTIKTVRYEVSRGLRLRKSMHPAKSVSVDKPALYIVRLEPPPGWEAIPAEYRVSKDAENLDFTLRRKTSP
jgi:hypothetical protein